MRTSIVNGKEACYEYGHCADSHHHRQLAGDHRGRRRGRGNAWASPRSRRAEAQQSHVAGTTREEIEVDNSEILANAAGRGEEIVVEREGLRAVFTRDGRGALRVCMEGRGHSKAELRKIGQELVDRVTQQYVYHRVITELKQREHARRFGRSGGRPHRENPRPQLVKDRHMAREELEIEISPSGKVTARTIGIKGLAASIWPISSPGSSAARNLAS